MTEPHLRSLLNNAEMTKTYILNPLAPEFIPKAAYPGQQGQPVFISHTGQIGPAVGWPANHPAAYRGPHPQVSFSIFSLSVLKKKSHYCDC